MVSAKKPVTRAKTKAVVKAPAKRTKAVPAATESTGTTRRKVVAAPINYFASGTDKNLQWVSSGCELFDQMLGGGWVLGRVANIVGDKSSGKTLQAIEACANFHMQYPTGKIRYAESEAAFDQAYAAALGMPIDAISFAENIYTVEEWYEDLIAELKSLNGRPGLYILDSLDALSDKAEQERDIDKGSYNMSKAKLIGELFRRAVQEIEASNMLLIVISQIRDKIGVSFGETKTRSGGKALDFYATHVVWLQEIGKMKRTIDKVERVVGLEVQALCKKNKVGLPFRKVQYPLLFGYGVDDVTANTEWLIAVGKLEDYPELGLSASGYKVRIGNLRNKGGDEIRALRKQLNAAVAKEWSAIETKFLPTAGKY